MQAMVDSIDAAIDGETVRIEIKKPDGFAEAMKKMVARAESEAKSTNKMNEFRQAGLAVLNYESAYREFPFDREEDELGWRVHILPFMEENKTYRQFDMDAGVEDEQNAKMANKMPKSFGTDGKNSSIVWIKSDVNTFAGITDGSSNTVMLIEYPAGEPWIENGGLSIEKAVELVSGLDDGQELIITMYDCSTRKITNEVDEETLKNLFNPKDGNVIDWNF